MRNQEEGNSQDSKEYEICRVHLRFAAYFRRLSTWKLVYHEGTYIALRFNNIPRLLLVAVAVKLSEGCKVTKDSVFRRWELSSRKLSGM